MMQFQEENLASEFIRKKNAVAVNTTKSVVIGKDKTPPQKEKLALKNSSKPDPQSVKSPSIPRITQAHVFYNSLILFRSTF